MCLFLPITRRRRGQFKTIKLSYLIELFPAYNWYSGLQPRDAQLRFSEESSILARAVNARGSGFRVVPLWLWVCLPSGSAGAALGRSWPRQGLPRAFPGEDQAFSRLRVTRRLSRGNVSMSRLWLLLPSLVICLSGFFTGKVKRDSYLKNPCLPFLLDVCGSSLRLGPARRYKRFANDTTPTLT